jgi:hypothetical protein
MNAPNYPLNGTPARLLLGLGPVNSNRQAAHVAQPSR